MSCHPLTVIADQHNCQDDLPLTSSVLISCCGSCFTCGLWPGLDRHCYWVCFLVVGLFVVVVVFFLLFFFFFFLFLFLKVVLVAYFP